MTPACRQWQETREQRVQYNGNSLFVYWAWCATVQVDFPVEPGDRLMLQLVEVDVPAGHYRLTVTVRGVLLIVPALPPQCWQFPAQQ